MTTACAATLVPSAKRTVRDEPVLSSATTERAVTSSAPNFTACRRARSASWAPGTPSGKPEVFLYPPPLPRLPAGGALLDQHRPQPLRGAVHRCPQPRRSAPDDDQVVEVGTRIDVQPHHGGESRGGRREEHLPVVGEHHRQILRSRSGGGQQPPALRLVDAVPAVGHGVAGQEGAALVGGRRPPVPDDPHVVEGRVGGGPPAGDHVVDDRVELLLDRLPWLEQVVVDVDEVDCLDRRLGVGVGGEQRPPGPGEEVHRLLEELDAVHLRHPVVGEQHGHRVAAQLELAQRVQPLAGRRRPQHPEVLAVAAPQVAGHGSRHSGVVVHAEQDRLAHGVSRPAVLPPIGVAAHASPVGRRRGTPRNGPGPRGYSRSRTTCTAASSAEAAPPSMPSSRASSADSVSVASPPSRSSSRPARSSPTSSSSSSPSVSEVSPSPSPSSGWFSGSSRASRPPRLSPVDSSHSVVPQSSTAQGRSAGAQTVSRTSGTPPESSSVSSGSRTPEASSGSVPSVP